MGPDAFRSGFPSRYESDGYTQFVGRTLNELGMSLLRAEEWDDAFGIFIILTELFPKAPQVYDSLAFAFLSRGEPTKAAEVFRQALDLDPDFSSDYSSDNYGAGGQPPKP
jgi:tetratricopeptide (TPR) repeat protein